MDNLTLIFFRCHSKSLKIGELLKFLYNSPMSIRSENFLFSRLLLLSFTLVMVACSPGSETTKLKVSLGLSIDESVLDKAMLHGVDQRSGIKFAKVISTRDLSMDVPNGEWDFYLTFWEDQNHMGSATECAMSSMRLEGEEVDLFFDLTPEFCKEYDSDNYDEGTGSFNQLNLVACASAPNISSTPLGDECDFQVDNNIKSYKIILNAYSFTKYFMNSPNEGNGLQSCVNANNAGPALTYIDPFLGHEFPYLPILDEDHSPFAVTIITYDQTNCGDTNKLNVLFFSEGLLKPVISVNSGALFTSDHDTGDNFLYLMPGGSDMIVIPEITQPTEISGLKVWLDGADVASMHVSAGCSGGGVTDGVDIGCVEDKSGNGHHAYYITGNQPVFSTGIQNGLPVMAFNNSQLNITDSPQLDSGPALTAYIVFQSNSGAGSVRSLLYKDSGVIRTFDFYLDTNDRLRNFTDDGVGGVYYSASDDSFLDLQPYISGFEISNMGQILLKDGNVDHDSLEVNSNMSRVNDSTGSIQIGGDGSSYLDGYIMEVLYFDRVLNPGEKQAIDFYLKAKWGL